MKNNESVLKNSKCISIVSGKGGSGKTMIAASMADVLDSIGYSVLLIDADYGTAGLTYYMGLNTVTNISVGLTNLSLLKSILPDDIQEYSQKMKGFSKATFIGVGDHKRHLKSPNSTNLQEFFAQLIVVAKSMVDFVLIDCRGGIDDESIAVCKGVDDVIIIAETDTTSFQATQFLVDVLYDYDLTHKISGFIINKVFDDPSAFARAGTASFKSQYLNSVPFDLSATKSFLLGELPNHRSMFTSQIWHALYKLLPDKIEKPTLRSLTFRDFRGLSLRDNDSVLGGIMISFTAMGLTVVIFAGDIFRINMSQLVTRASITALIVLAVISGIEPLRSSIGRFFNLYKDLISRIFLGK